jgi:glycosyltransferase involved in cell wall biosynthesis
VVATETEGAKEVVEDRRTGLLVPIGNVESIAGAVNDLLANSERRLKMGASAQAAANERFNLTRMVDQIERIYAADLRG